MGIVYKATSPSGKSYIGITIHSLGYRKSQHYHAVRKGSNLLFHKALRKYEPSDIIWEIIDTTDSFESLRKKEIEYVLLFNTFKRGYNMTRGGDNLTPMSDERKQKLSKEMKGAGNFMYGKKHSEETRLKISEANKGLLNGYKCGPWSDERKTRQKEARKGWKFQGDRFDWTGRKHTEETKKKQSISSKKRIPLVCEETGQKFDSTSQLSGFINIDNSYLSKLLKKGNGKFSIRPFTYKRIY